MARLVARFAFAFLLALLVGVAVPAAGCKSEPSAKGKVEQSKSEGAGVAGDVGEKAENLAEEAKPVGRKIGEKAEELGDEAVEIGKEIGRKGDELIEETRQAIKKDGD